MTINVTGFSLVCSPKMIEHHANESINVEHIELLGKYYAISYGNNITRLQVNDSIIFIDGYTFPDDFSEIAHAVSAENFQYLNKTEGHFCGVVINHNGVLGFNDRYGGKTLYWQKHDNNLTLTSRINEMYIHNSDVSKEALCESFYYRWTTGRNTLFSSVEKLMVRHVVNFDKRNNAVQQGYWYLPQPAHNLVTLSKKISMTKSLLVDALQQASKRYKKVAIFLSGGVDSSILAALSKDIFEQCYLITPVFSGEKNPELENAKIFAKTLGLPHHLIEIAPSALENDLKQLISLKREPLRHYSSLAMMAMMRAVPADYDAVIYGEAADTLYGSNGIKRFITHATWKKQSQNIPLFLLKLLQKLIPGRGNVLVALKNKSLRDILLSITEIKYSNSEKRVIEQLCGESRAVLNDWLWHKTPDEVSAEMLRHVAQERILTSDAAVHFNEAEIIAQYYGKHIISPFFCEESIQLSRTLSDDEYFGNSSVKPVLRELACEFFPRELIYQKKHGFPVPFISWLEGPLSYLVSELKAERKLFDGRMLDHFNIEDNFEIFWLLINWQLLEPYFNNHCIADSTL
jgi:asparagine synthase (glutamine-hydrolysing)